ncbi:MAG: helix-turn-helix domain-containing protein [Atopobiaceae bacterium]|nr:helix-turn-helix domain-containing protein [Atopobiaceae bacterium]
MAKEVDRIIGNTLRVKRRKLGLTQVQVAHTLHTSQTFISKTESGARSLRVTEAVLYSLGVNMTPHQLYKELKSALHDHGYA